MEDFQLSIHYADCRGRESNCRYPHNTSVHNAEELKPLLAFDHTFISFRNNYRDEDNFLCTDVVVVDCDNEHSDNADDWYGYEDFCELFSDVQFLAYTSRNHMKQKKEYSPRPRLRLIFPVNEITKADDYKKLLKRLQNFCPIFDANAMDAARFFYGNPDAEIFFHRGTKSMTDFLDDAEAEEFFNGIENEYHQGERNSKMHLRAVQILKRYGDTDEAISLFYKEAEKCTPPLDNEELEAIFRSAGKFYSRVITKQADYKPPDVYNASVPKWEKPIPFDEYNLPDFPVDALPPPIAAYVSAVAESTQTPVDMAAASVLPVIAVCIQGKYVIRAKDDWTEPLNIYVENVMEPSERKSAVHKAEVRPLDLYEQEMNLLNSGAIEASKMHKRILERRQKALEDQAAKGKVEPAELEKIAQDIASYEEKKPLRLYVDDVTTEKLTSILAENKGRAAILSTEGGIFDTLAGIYTKNVNIDVILKGYSGDCIKVDRVGRVSESIMNPTLTILLMVQPSVLSGMMQNGTFRGRGLTARFLYCIPKSSVGKRKYRSSPVSPEIYREYELRIRNMLEDEYEAVPEVITLSPGRFAH